MDVRAVLRGFALGTLAVSFTLLAFSSPSLANEGPRHVPIDFGYDTPTSGDNDGNGEAWEILPGVCAPLDQDGSSAVGCVLDYSTADAAANSSGLVSLGFDVNLNGVIYKKVHVNQNGILTFGSALGAWSAVTDFASLETAVGNATHTSNPFIAAFYPSTTPLDIPAASNPGELDFNGGAEYGRGLANPTSADVGVSPDIDGDVLAFKASWFECPVGSSNAQCTVFPTNPVQARIILYDRYDGTKATADGDFDVRFEYDLIYDTGTAAGGQFGVIGFDLGSTANTVNLSGSSTAPTAVPGLTDIYYQFRGGVLVGAVSAVSVPNVLNDTLAQASTAITGAGLIVGSTATQSSSTVPSGEVISQNPTAGTSAPAGSAVNLMLSSGPLPSVGVPSVVGDTLAAATSALKTVGLVVGTTSQQSSTSVPAGSVISQSPAAMTKVASGSAVNVVLSTGPAKVTVPNVVHDTLAAATQALQGAGLMDGSNSTQSSSSVPSGSIISQSPAAGASVLAGSKVNLVVSRGALRGDVNGDGQVDVLDLLIVLRSFGHRVSAGDPRDLNGDLIVNLKDAAILVNLCTYSGCAIKPHH